MNEQKLDWFFHQLIEEYGRHLPTAGLIQKAFRLVHQMSPGMGSIVVTKNPKSDYLRISHSFNIFRSSIGQFQRPVGTGRIAHLFFAEPVVTVTPDDRKGYQEFLLEDPFGMAVAARIAASGRTLGYVAAYFETRPARLNELKEFLYSVGMMIGASMEREQLEDMARDLRRVDPITGLLCPQYFLLKLHEEVEKCHRFHYPMVTALFDIDNFKEMINLHGLSTAQEVLREVGEILRGCIRAIDEVGTFGTDELFMFLPNTELKAAQSFVRRFRTKLNGKTFTKEKITTTVSIGMTQLRTPDTAESLVTRTQVAFHQARRNGPGLLEVIS